MKIIIVIGLIILFVIAFAVSKLFSWSEIVKIDIDVSEEEMQCTEYSLKVKENIKDIRKQINLCREGCQDRGWNFSYSSCKEGILSCRCLI